MLRLNIKKTFEGSSYGFRFSSQETQEDIVKQLTILGYRCPESIAHQVKDPTKVVLIDPIRKVLDWDYKSNRYPLYLSKSEQEAQDLAQRTRYQMLGNLTQEEIYNGICAIIRKIGNISVRYGVDDELLTQIMEKGQVLWNSGHLFSQHRDVDADGISIEYRDRLRIFNNRSHFPNELTPIDLLSLIQDMVNLEG